jgi:peptidoglycan hydrolase-like protein with peptidoglycan-binding domain
MKYNFSDIAEWYIKKLVTSSEYFSPNPVRVYGLLFPDFKDLMNELFLEATKININLISLETYRSNVLQLEYYHAGASGIPKNGMHHYGIACDTIFKDKTGHLTYKGPYAKMHEIYESLGGPDLGKLEINDAGHFQLIPISQQNDLRSEVDHVIRAFQDVQGLVIDGIVGPKTQAAAKEYYK